VGFAGLEKIERGREMRSGHIYTEASIIDVTPDIVQAEGNTIHRRLKYHDTHPQRARLPFMHTEM
jgi:hypothetical protein